MPDNEPTLPRDLMLVAAGIFQALFWLGFVMGWDGDLGGVFIILSLGLVLFNPWIYQGD